MVKSLKGLLEIEIRISKVEAVFRTSCLYFCFRLVLDLNPTVLSNGVFNVSTNYLTSCFSFFGMTKHANCPRLRRYPSKGRHLGHLLPLSTQLLLLGCNVLCLYKSSSAQVLTLLQRCTSLFSFFKILSQLESWPSLLCVYMKLHCPIFFIYLGIYNATGNFFHAKTMPHSCPAFCYCRSYRKKFSVHLTLSFPAAF